jgi:hypothetical protein
VAERRRDDGEGWRRLELDARVEEGERELGSEGEWCGVLWQWSSPFIGAGERRDTATGGNGRSNGLNAIDGRVG